ncbi:MAG: copper resistance protein B, partial [Cypionkella sp.]
PPGAAPSGPAPAGPCAPEHAAMGHCTMPAREDAAPADPHAGHAPAAPASAAPPPLGPPPPEALSGPAHAADRVFDPVAMARSRAQLAREHGGLAASKLAIDRLELGFGRGRDRYAWEAQAWHGGDRDKLWLESEGEGALGGAFEGAEFQALWSRAIDPWFDLQLGLRQDVARGPDRTHLVAGVRGLAPYWFEVDAAVFVSNAGDVTARGEVEYDLRLTQALILQPRGEADFALQRVPELGLGSGLTSASLGARLRYEFFPRAGPAVIAPYIGVEAERAFGGTARLRRLAGEPAGGTRAVVGLRTWF